MSTSPQIGQLVSIPDGVAVARISMQHIVVGPAPANGKYIQVQDGERSVTFLLDRDQCAHLAQILLSEADGRQNGVAVTHPGAAK